ncbi:hypothetical protein apy_10210 [Aeropyrum pernix]|uniref:Uncharacterized protein n=1 Tax=Aeropyrum pernix TaxID=56636 RepID=A0A401HA08_AERPX|nr:hypothetical protein [Aeropyrum pernix]GBF09296.1 hypothetical protein apy_10210 [Aeropyrum pernix]
MLDLLVQAAHRISGIFRGMFHELAVTLKAMMSGHAVDTLQMELEELENVFATVIIGSLAGMPLAPLGLAVEVAGYMEEEISLMIEKHAKYRDGLAAYASLGG